MGRGTWEEGVGEREKLELELAQTKKSVRYMGRMGCGTWEEWGEREKKHLGLGVKLKKCWCYIGEMGCDIWGKRVRQRKTPKKKCRWYKGKKVRHMGRVG